MSCGASTFTVGDVLCLQTTITENNQLAQLINNLTTSLENVTLEK